MLVEVVMREQLWEKVKESISSVMPITLIVLFLQFILPLIVPSAEPMPANMLFAFLIGAVFLIFGMGLFTLGADISMMPMGEKIGAHIIKSKHYFILIPVVFLIGSLITVAEPDLSVLASQFANIGDWTIILTVAAGVGLFLVLALLRVLKGISLSKILIICYISVFAIASLVPKYIIPVAFDSGGVTTGPITVPFIMALGIGFATVRGSKSSHDDSFGMIALCSVGPILSMLVLGLVSGTDSVTSESSAGIAFDSISKVLHSFGSGIPHYAVEVAKALLPIIGMFVLFQFIFLHLSKKSLMKYGIGIIYTYAGLVLFLAGVNTGFLPVGAFFGGMLAKTSVSWLLIPIGMLMGFFVVMAEPAVRVLNKQIEEITVGAISQRAMLISLSIGVAISVGISMLRVITGISLWYFILPGYLLALAITLVVPKIFTAIAFDSGGVASGPMTATFILPFAMGACDALGGDLATDAFGIVAMVAMTPLITIQLLGVAYRIKMRAAERIAERAVSDAVRIIEFEWEDC